jgi:hypothetical protein
MSVTAKSLSPRLYFSYGQFMVFDQSEQMPGCDWTAEHTGQGFARRESTVCFGTTLEFGHADVAVAFGAYQQRADYERVIAVPFYSGSGKVTVEGPEEMDAERVFDVPIGNYKLTAAQTVIGETEERIDLFFESVATPLKHSSIIVADEMLHPPEPLIETSEIAGA